MAAFFETLYAVQTYLEDDGSLSEAVDLWDLHPGAAQYGLHTGDGILIASILLKLCPVLVKRPVPLHSTFALHNIEDLEVFAQLLHGKCYTPGSVQAAVDTSNSIKRMMEHEATIHAHAVEMHIENISSRELRVSTAHIREVEILRSILSRLPSPIVHIEPQRTNHN